MNAFLILVAIIPLFTHGHVQQLLPKGMGDVEYGKIYDFYLPPAFLRLYDGPSVNVEDMWRILGRGTTNGGLVVGTIIKPKLGLQPKPFGEACYSFWPGR